MNPHPHEKSTELFAGLAESFKVDVDSCDKDKWSAALTMAKALDNLVDDDHIYDSRLYSERVMQGERIPYLTNEEVEFVRTTYESLSSDSQERWQQSAAKLGAFALKRIEADNIHDYLMVVAEESLLMADVLLVEADSERSDIAQRQTFNDWMPQAICTIYALDTCSDFIKDHNEGNMSVPISPRAVGALARCAFAESFKLAKITPLSAYSAVANRAITKTIEKASQSGFWSNQFIWDRSR